MLAGGKTWTGWQRKTGRILPLIGLRCDVTESVWLVRGDSSRANVSIRYSLACYQTSIRRLIEALRAGGRSEDPGRLGRSGKLTPRCTINVSTNLMIHGLPHALPRAMPSRERPVFPKFIVMWSARKIDSALFCRIPLVPELASLNCRSSRAWPGESPQLAHDRPHACVHE